MRCAGLALGILETWVAQCQVKTKPLPLALNQDASIIILGFQGHLFFFEAYHQKEDKVANFHCNVSKRNWVENFIYFYAPFFISFSLIFEMKCNHYQKQVNLCFNQDTQKLNCPIILFLMLCIKLIWYFNIVK